MNNAVATDTAVIDRRQSKSIDTHRVRLASDRLRHFLSQALRSISTVKLHD